MSERGWHAQLTLRYRRDGERCIAHDLHEGPLRVLQPLYPEGPGICHHVVVHPPGGVVGGDTLHLGAELADGCHALITTPGATRFYRSEGAPAQQQVQLALHGASRLEWLPMEAIAYSGCIAASAVQMTLAPAAQMIGWDLLALGLPAAGRPFAAGRFTQQLQLPGVWLERGCIAAADTVLRDGGAGLAGHSVLGTAWFAAGSALPQALREALLDGARAAITTSPLAATAGATSPQAPLVLLRVLSHGVEPAMQLLAAVRAAWRQAAWGLTAAPPRIWTT
ncbi:MAG: urease accessory protein UreD [Rubrivivax sp.]|nr:urease accessory protein UreD [Rubrivivax sp.]